MKSFKEFLNEERNLKSLKPEEMYVQLVNGLLSGIGLKDISTSNLSKKGSKYRYEFTVTDPKLSSTVSEFRQNKDRSGWRSFYESKVKKTLSSYNIGPGNLEYDDLAGIGWMSLNYTGNMPKLVNVTVVLKPKSENDLDVVIMIDQKGKMSDIKTVLADTLGI